MMLKEFTTPSGVVSHCHMLRRIEVELPLKTATLTVHSYASEVAYLAGAGLVWNSQVQMPLGMLDGDLCDIAETWLVSAVDSPFAGGTIIVDQSQTLDAAKVRAWTRIKVARTRAEFSDFTCAGAIYQADKDRITGATQLALLAQVAARPFSIDWTLSDNTSLTLDAAGMIAVGAALGAHVTGAFVIGRALREQIASASTIEQVDAIQWPAAE